MGLSIDSNPLLGAVRTIKLIQSLKEESLNSKFKCYSEVKLYEYEKEINWLNNSVVTMTLEGKMYIDWLRNEREIRKSKLTIA